jgi:hypothetical protein
MPRNFSAAKFSYLFELNFAMMRPFLVSINFLARIVTIAIVINNL